MCAPTMFAPSVSGRSPTMNSSIALPIQFTYSRSPGLAEVTLLIGTKPRASASRTASRTHSRSVLPASRNAR